MAVPRLFPRRVPALVTGVVAVSLGAGALAGGPVSAEPRPTIAQVQRQVAALNHQAEQATERYNRARVELTQTDRRLRAVRNRYERSRRSLEEMRAVVGRIAVASYKAGGVDSGLALVMSQDPTTFLRQAADLAQLGRRQSALLRNMATARLRLAQDRKAVRQQRARAAALEAELARQKRVVEGKLAAARRVLGSLQAEQRARLAAQRRQAEEQALDARSGALRASRDARDGTFPTYDGPASGRAAVAVRAAYAQLGDPYVWAAAGPGSFDCSGLTMFAWGAAGVALPHSSSAQYAAVRHVSVDDLQPGDLVFYYSPISHVAIYVGGGKVIDAPYPGRSVHITGLYSMPLVGAGRP
jgi:cell wall-associated NlpC family hydrolase